MLLMIILVQIVLQDRVNEVFNNNSTERSNKVNDITVNESNESSGGLREVNAINPNVALLKMLLRWSLLM